MQMQTFNTQMFAQLSAGTASTAEALRTLVRDKPTPNLTVPPWTPSNKQEWVKLIKARVSQCPYFRVLFNATEGELTEALAQTHREEDIQLSSRILKQLDATTKDLMSMDVKVSGYRIYNAITRIANMTLSTDEIETLQQNWLNMERGNNETIDA
eukprot:15344960-Ditylum_brightwellii.AAC.1